MDHSTGSLRLDLEHTWQSSQQAQPLLPPADQICDDQVRGSTGSCLSLYGALHGCQLVDLALIPPLLASPRLETMASIRESVLGCLVFDRKHWC